MLRLEVIGEGFHRATLYDPDGYPVAAVQQFVDLGDTKCYELELKAPVDGRAKGWALEIYKARILSIEGLLPYWANTLEELFNPEQVQELES
jgi:hypothetical protein